MHQRLRVPLRIARLGPMIVPMLLSLTVYWFWLGNTRPLLTGDEGCYFAQTQSLGHDGDLDLTDELNEPGGVIDLVPDIARGEGCAEDFRHDGKLRSWFSPGLSILLAPVLRFRFSVMFVRFGLILVASLFAQQLYGWLRDISERRGWRLHIVWVMTALMLPAIGFSNQLYPEVPAALLCTLAGRSLLRAGHGRKWALAASGAAAYLPWLHYRFAVIAGALTLLAMSLGVSRGGEPGAWLRRALRERWWVLVVPLASSLALALLYVRLYGSPLPWAPYSGGGASISALTPLQSYRVGVGTLLRPTAGIIPINPFLWLGVVGLIAFARRFGAAGWCILGVVLVQLFVVNPLGFFGYSLPGRFAVVLLPVLGAGALVALERSAALAAIAPGLAILSLGLAVSGYLDYSKLYDLGRLRTGWQRATAPIWPPNENLSGISTFSLGAETLVGKVGRLIESPSGVRLLVAEPRDGPGILASTPEIELRQGTYVVSLEVSGSASGQGVAGSVTIEQTNPRRVISSNIFRWDQTFPPPGREYATIALPLRAPDQTARVVPAVVISIRVFGNGELFVRAIHANPSARLDPPDVRVRKGIPLALIWLGLTLTLALNTAFGTDFQFRDRLLTQ